MTGSKTGGSISRKSQVRSKIKNRRSKSKSKSKMLSFLPRLWERQKAEHLDTENCLEVSNINTWLHCT